MALSHSEYVPTFYPDGSPRGGLQRDVYTDPHKRPNPYWMRKREGSCYYYLKDGRHGTMGGLGYWRGDDMNEFPHAADQPTINKAYSRFRDKAVGDSGQLGTFIAELKESVGMINQRVLQLYGGYRDLRRGNLKGFADRFSVRVRNKHGRLSASEVSNSAGSLWLEYWFGWAPAADDVMGLAHNMSQPFPASFPAKGSATGHRHETADYSEYKVDFHYRTTVKTGGVVTVVNPNAFLAARMGIANPGQIIWEVIPFSFLADWAFDVSSFIESFTDFYGCEISDPYSVYYGVTQERIHSFDPQYYLGHSGGYFTCHRMKRTTSIPRPMPNLQFTANIGQSLTRVASAASLLAVIFKSASGRPNHRLDTV